MKITITVAVLATAAALLAAQGRPTSPRLPLPPPLPQPEPVRPIVCTGSESPCDPDRPWMRGAIEKFCGTAGMLERLKKELGDGRQILACSCRHTCDPNYKHHAATDNRGWDGRCQARCNPKNCRCPSPCDT